MLTKKRLKNILEQIMINESGIFLDEVPFAKHLTDPNEELNDEYYIRHRIETIKRIQMTARVDALALYYMVDEDYEASRFWSEYITEELDHDRIFINDLAVHGVGLSRIQETNPFSQTIDMVDYLIGKIHRIGSLPAVAYSIYVEWNSDLYSRKTVEKARKQYSEAHVRGAQKHSEIDNELNHYDVIVNVAHGLLQKKNSVEDLILLLRDIGKYFRLYFAALYEETIQKKALHFLSYT